MPVTDIISMTEMQLILDALLDTCTHNPLLGKTLQVESVGADGSGKPDLGIVGSAYEYALGWCLEREHPRCFSGTWIAERSLKVVSATNTVTGEQVQVPKAQIGETIREARAVVQRYLGGADVTTRDLCKQAVRLARINPIYRRGRFDPSFTDDRQSEIRDAAALLLVTDWRLFQGAPLVINPRFGILSEVMDADCDFIAGDTLIEVKTTRNATLNKNDVRQAAAYALLARLARVAAQSAHGCALPEIRRAVLYYPRFDVRLAFDVAELLARASDLGGLGFMLSPPGYRDGPEVFWRAVARSLAPMVVGQKGDVAMSIAYSELAARGWSDALLPLTHDPITGETVENGADENAARRAGEREVLPRMKSTISTGVYTGVHTIPDIFGDDLS